MTDHPVRDANFRLSPRVKPRRYDIRLSLDFEQRTFVGVENVTLDLAQDEREIVLHANGLTVTRAVLRQRDASLSPARLWVEPASETLVLELPRPLTQGQAELELHWTGEFFPGLRGLYLAGKVAATQFEAADARRVFPCFDEPAFKARWALRVELPKDLTVLSNGRALSEETLAPTRAAAGETQPNVIVGQREESSSGLRKLVTFEETEVLSSYLIALVAGPLVSSEAVQVGKVPLRTWSLASKAHLSGFAQEVGAAVLPRLEGYFGQPYAFGKVDQVGIPDFEAGAMENAGLITFREVALLLDPKTAPLAVQKRVAEVVTHELAHQWFGNWVTMRWWDDLWLNEAFATWMAFKMVDAWKPSWRMWLDFDTGKASALHLDALSSTHPVRGTVRNAREAGESFDAITYEKGGAVLRMLEGFLGEAAFRDGIRLYMTRHARANAEADDLWSALALASDQPVNELANAWTQQSGYPLVGVELQGSSVRLSQQRFYSEPGVRSDERWPVPVVLRYPDGDSVREQRVLLRGTSADLLLEGASPPAWICANAGSTGFYRVSYSDELLRALALHLPALQPSERIGLLGDAWARVRSNRLEVQTFLDLAGRFSHEVDDAVLDELVGKLAFIESRLTEGDDQLRFRSFVERLLNEQWAGIGWDPAQGEADSQRLRRGALLRAMGLIARVPPLVQEARARVERRLDSELAALDPNLLDAATTMAARAGDARLFDRLQAAFHGENDPAPKRRYLFALTAFEAPALVTRAQAFLFDGDVPMQDTAGYVHGLLANRVGRATFWTLLRARWKDVLARTGGAALVQKRLVEALGQLCERSQLEEARAFFHANPFPEAEQAVAQTLERLAQDVALRERATVGVRTWLRARLEA